MHIVLLNGNLLTVSLSSSAQGRGRTVKRTYHKSEVQPVSFIFGVEGPLCGVAVVLQGSSVCLDFGCVASSDLSGSDITELYETGCEGKELSHPSACRFQTHIQMYLHLCHRVCICVPIYIGGLISQICSKRIHMYRRVQQFCNAV